MRVGSAYFVESFTVPVIISSIFKTNSEHNFSVSCFRCRFNSDKSKIIGIDFDFLCTINSNYFLRSPNTCKGKFVLRCSSKVTSLVSSAQSRLVSFQLANLGDVSYQRELGQHALGAQMRQAVLSSIDSKL